jgi:hypothetical protein
MRPQENPGAVKRPPATETPSPLPVANRIEAEAVLKQIAHLTGLLGATVALRDEEILQVNTRHQLQIEQLLRDIDRRKERIELWARANKETEFPAGSQSLELPDGRIFFRKGNRKLELLEGWDWDLSLARLLKFPVESQWGEYIKRDPEIDKSKLLRDSNGETPRLPEARLKTIGLQVVREERFDLEVRPGPALFDQAG